MLAPIGDVLLIAAGSRRLAHATRIAQLTLLAGWVGSAGCGGGGAGTAAVSPCADAFAPKLIATASGTPQSIDVRGTTLVAAFTDAATGDGSVLWVDLATRAERTLATGRKSPHAVAASSHFAYWLDTGPLGATGDISMLMRAPLDRSGADESLVPVTTAWNDILVADDTVFFSDNVALRALAPDATTPIDLSPAVAPLNLASDANYIYGASCGSVDRVAKGGGAAEHVADAFCALTLATDGTDVYFKDWSNGLYRVPATGGTASPVASNTPIDFSSIVMDDVNVYYGAGGLYRIGRAGGDPELIAAGMVTDIAADDACLYWADAMQTGVFTVQKM